MDVRIENGKLIVEMPLNDPPTPSRSSGKTMIACTTGGNVRTGVKLNGQELILGLNCYFYPTSK